MRLAKLDDLCKSLKKRNNAPRLARFKFSNLPGFGDTTLEPDKSFLAICGGTGVGKTAMLEVLHSALEPLTAGVGPKKGARFAAATVDVIIANGEDKYEVARTIADEPDADHDGWQPGVHLIRLETRTSYLPNHLSDANVALLKEGVEPSQLDKITIEIVRDACRKPYTAINVWEVEPEGGRTVPFFEVTLEGVAYDNRMMATGELSVLYLAWVLKAAVANAIILIEEPEAHLPPSSHAAVFALIANAALHKNLCVILTTHSSTIAEHVPDDCLVSVKSSGITSTLPQTAESKSRVLSRLGLRPKINACFFVEDALAQNVLTEILAAYDFGLVCNVEVVVAKSADKKGQGAGDGAIKKSIESLPDGIKTVRFVGAVDGDAKEGTKNWKCKDRLVFLPFAAAMEIELVQALEADIIKGAQALRRSVDSLSDALEATRGKDHHDRFKEIAAALGLGEPELTRGALDRWREGAGKSTGVSRFAIEVARLLDIDLP